VQTTPVKSSNVRAIGYDESKRELRVEFHSGATHDFLGVPPEKHREMMAADSKGRYFHQHIRDSFAQRKMGLPPQQDEAGTSEPRPRLQRVPLKGSNPELTEYYEPIAEAGGAASPEAALGEAVKRYQERPEKPGR